eukprot:102525-Pleurochrysis_carterae.AAC.2
MVAAAAVKRVRAQTNGPRLQQPRVRGLASPLASVSRAAYGRPRPVNLGRCGVDFLRSRINAGGSEHARFRCRRRRTCRRRARGCAGGGRPEGRARGRRRAVGIAPRPRRLCPLAARSCACLSASSLAIGAGEGGCKRVEESVHACSRRAAVIAAGAISGALVARTMSAAAGVPGAVGLPALAPRNGLCHGRPHSPCLCLCCLRLCLCGGPRRGLF